MKSNSKDQFDSNQGTLENFNTWLSIICWKSHLLGEQNKKQQMAYIEVINLFPIKCKG